MKERLSKAGCRGEWTRQPASSRSRRATSTTAMKALPDTADPQRSQRDEGFEHPRAIHAPVGESSKLRQPSGNLSSSRTIARIRLTSVDQAHTRVLLAPLSRSRFQAPPAPKSSLQFPALCDRIRITWVTGLRLPRSKADLCPPNSPPPPCNSKSCRSPSRCRYTTSR
jgi:hypothetical protein